MKYGELIMFRWSKRIETIIIVFFLCAFLIGLTIGYVAGVITLNNKEVQEDTPIIPTEPTEIPEPTQETTSIYIESQPTEIYYDCPLSADLQEYIRALCQENELPMSLVIAMIDVESDFNPDVISSTNDYGLMQINKCNHEWLSKDYGITDFLDPYQNIFCGVTIISQHYNRYQDINKALMAYNLGATGAKKFWNKGIYTTEYTRKVTNAMEVYNG